MPQRMREVFAAFTQLVVMVHQDQRGMYLRILVDIEPTPRSGSRCSPVSSGEVGPRPQSLYTNGNSTRCHTLPGHW
jgi:hypothetical protein